MVGSKLRVSISSPSSPLFRRARFNESCWHRSRKGSSSFERFLTLTPLSLFFEETGRATFPSSVEVNQDEGALENSGSSLSSSPSSFIEHGK